MSVEHTSRGVRLIPGTSNPHGETGAALFLLPYSEPGSASLSSVTLPPGYSADPCCQKRPFKLRIFHINDLHGHISRFTEAGQLTVLSRIVWKIRESRREWKDQLDRAVLFLSSGDNWDGAIYDDLLSESEEIQQSSSYFSLFSKMGLDAMGVGNHDFSPGFERLVQAIGTEADFPVFAANLSLPQGAQQAIIPAGVLVVQGVRVGLIGVTTRAETHLENTSARILDPISSVQPLVAALRPVCDVLIIISHLGHCLEHSPVPMADAGDVQLASSLPEGSVDLIVGGHSHSVLNSVQFQPQNLVNGIPIVQAGAGGEYLGQVDLCLFDGSAKIDSARLWPVFDLEVDKEFEQDYLDPIQASAESLRERVLGQVGAELWRQKEKISKRFSQGEEALANFLSDALVKRLAFRGHAVDFAMLDASALQSGLPEGSILTYGDCFKLMPFLDKIVIYTMTGLEVRELINDNACRFGYLGSEKGFLQFSQQLRYRLNRGSAPTDSYSDRIRINGIPLENLAGRRFQIGTTSFSRAAALSWENHLEDPAGACIFKLHDYPWQDTGLFFRHEMISYIVEQGGITKAGGARRDGRLEVNPPWED